MGTNLRTLTENSARKKGTRDRPTECCMSCYCAMLGHTHSLKNKETKDIQLLHCCAHEYPRINECYSCVVQEAVEETYMCELDVGVFFFFFFFFFFFWGGGMCECKNLWVGARVRVCGFY